MVCARRSIWRSTRSAYPPAWRGVWGDVLPIVEENPVLVLRDYHADNLMVLPGRAELGLLDFQDALAGHAAYDLVSLLQERAATSRRSSRRR